MDPPPCFIMSLKQRIYRPIRGLEREVPGGENSHPSMLTHLILGSSS
jgi:hypothetical protein